MLVCEQSQTHLQYAPFSVWTRWPWRGAGDWQAYHRWGSNSIPGQRMCVLWWTQGHWDRFLSQYVSFHLQLLLHHCYLFIFHSSPTTQ